MEDPGRRAQNPAAAGGGTSVLDRPAARVAAFLVFVSVAAALAWIHRDDLFPDDAAVAADDPVAKCIAARAADIAQMRRDGIIDAERAAVFTSRAEALCQAQFGKGSGPLGLPQ